MSDTFVDNGGAAPARGQATFERVIVDGLVLFLIQEDWMTQMLKRSGTWERHLYDLVSPFLSESANVLDLGANFGFHSIKLAKLCNRGSVFAYEPVNLVFSQLQANVLANSVENVRTFKFAVTDSSFGIVQMQPIESNGWAKGINIGNTGIGAGGDFAFTLRIDDCTLPKIDFIKIDIQGSEILALRGMTDLVARDRPLFFIEIEEHHLRRMGTSSQEVIGYFLERDYSLLRIKNDWPTDHICIPNERCEAIATRMMANGVYETQLISGKRVELAFSNQFHYDSFVCE